MNKFYNHDIYNMIAIFRHNRYSAIVSVPVDRPEIMIKKETPFKVIVFL
jgi:hypothetical protein